MQNFQHAIDATNTALNSAGSAAKENASYMESLEASENALAAEFEDFANRVLSNDVVKGFLEAGTSMLDFANNDVGAAITRIGLLATGMTGLTGIAGQTVGKIAEVGLQLKNLGVGGGSFLGMLASGKVALIVGGVVLSVTALVEIIRALKSSYDEAHPSFEEANKNLEKTQDEISQTTDKLKEYKDQLAKLDEVAIEDRGAAWQSERSELELNIEASQSYLDILERIRELQGQQAYAADRPTGYTAAGSITKNQFQDETYYGAYQATGDRSVQLSAKQADVLNAQYSDQYQALTAITLALADVTDEQYRWIEAEDLAELQGKSQEEQIEIMTDMLGKLGIALDTTYESSEQAFSNMEELASKAGDLSQAQKEQAQTYIDSYGEIVKVGAATKEQVTAYVELAAKLNDVNIASGNAYETIALLANILGVTPAYARDLAISVGLIDANTRPAAGALVQLENGTWAVADGLNAVKDASNGVSEAMSNISVATYDTSTAAAQLTASLFDQNGQLTSAAQTALSVDSSLISMAQAELQAQQQAAQANYSKLILEIQKVGSAAMITAGQLSQMMALAGVSSAQDLVGSLASGASTDMEGLKTAFFRAFGKSADSDIEAFNKWVSSRVSVAGQSTYDKIMEETQKRLDELEKSFPTGTGGGSSGKSAEEKAAEEAEKQAKKAQQAQEKAASESQEAYESAAKSAEQAAQQAAQAAEQAAEEAKQKILDSIQELKDASDDFWDERTDAIEDANTELDRQKQLEEKLKALEEARQKKILLYKNGQFQYDKDYGTIAKAQADYEETRDKIQREKELEQLKEMKENATEIFNEMKDIISNGGDVTQTMINNWLKQMADSGVDYYDSNKQLLGEWLDWAKGAIKEFSQSALDAIGDYTSTSSIMSGGAYGASSSSSDDINWNRYMTDSTFWKDGEFVGLSTAFWIDRFEKQIKSGFEPENWLGGGKGTSVFDDWQEVLDYWAEYQGNELSGKIADVEAVEDMMERARAAQIVLSKYKDTFISLGYDEYAQLAERMEAMDIGKAAKTARMKGASAHPEDPFGMLGISPADYTTIEGKLYNLLDNIGWYEYYTGSRSAETESKEGKDYERLTIAADLAKTARLSNWHKASQKLFTDAAGDYYPGVSDVTFDEEKLKRFYDDNEAAIKKLHEMWFEARTDAEKEFIHLEAEARRQARDYTEEILGMSPSGRSEAERQANLVGVSYLDFKRDRVINDNVEKIKEHLEDAENGTAITQRYINNAKDYIAKVIEENSKKWFDTYDATEKEKLHQQNEQLRVLQEQLEQGRYENLLPGGENAGLTGWEQENQLEDFNIDAERLKQIRELREEMAANSAAWWDADEETRKRLHEANERLAKMISDMSNIRISYEGHTGTWTFDNTPGNANGTHNFRGGLSLVGERGPELRVLGQGDNIIPANQTANLWKWSNVTPQQMLTTLSARQGGQSTNYAFDVSRIDLPNVTDAKSFVQGLKNYALQYIYKR